MQETNNLLLKNNIELKFNSLSICEDVKINTDENRFVQIFNNLISNASKFTKNGSIEVGFSIKEELNGKIIEFYVKDTGCGIPKNKHELIFNRFWQAQIILSITNQKADTK